MLASDRSKRAESGYRLQARLPSSDDPGSCSSDAPTQPTLTPPCVPSQNWCYGTDQNKLRFNALCNREYANYRYESMNSNIVQGPVKISFFGEQGYTEARDAPRGACCCGGHCPAAAVWSSRAVRAGMR